MCHPRKNRQPHRTGLSYVEVVVASLLTGVVLLGALEGLGMAYRTQRHAHSRSCGPQLAAELLSEALSLAYEDPQNPGAHLGPDSGEGTGTRLDFDDCDDFDNWASDHAEARDGTVRSAFLGWRHQVFVAYVDPQQLSQEVSSDLGLKRIDVRVESPDGQETVLSGLRSRFGPLEVPPPTEVVCLHWTAAELQLSPNGPRLRTGSPLANEAFHSP